MKIPNAFVPFVEGAPCAVITRMVAERIVDEQLLEEVFQKHAVSQYHRQVTIDHLVAVMLDVTCGIAGSVRAGFRQRQKLINASLNAFYGKLGRIDPELGMGLVAEVAERLKPLIDDLRPSEGEPLPGVASFILDGNMLAGTEHRLKPLRGTRAAALPGKSLALFECATGLISQTVLWEDAHSQERALLPQLEVPPGAHLIADRNFCVLWFLREIENAKSYFTIRHHKQFTLPDLERARRVGRCETGVVYENRWHRDNDQGQPVVWRIITLKLDQPTCDGDTEIILISNLPKSFDARAIADAYRFRWTIEGHFQRLTAHLHCEIPSLGEPRAALFAFAMSLVAGNLLAVVIAALEAAHGKELTKNLSYHYLAEEISRNYPGMMLALPAPQWTFVNALSARDFAQLLCSIAAYANTAILQKSRRGPKKKRHTPNCTNIRHVSTKRVLDKYRELNAC